MSAPSAPGVPTPRAVRADGVEVADGSDGAMYVPVQENPFPTGNGTDARTVPASRAVKIHSQIRNTFKPLR